MLVPRQALRPSRPYLLPAFWVLVVLIAAGSWRVAQILRQAFGSYPVASTAAVLLFAAYAVPFLVLLRVIDFLAQQPPVLLGVAFAWGGLVATSAAISGSTAMQDVLAKRRSPQFAADWGPALVGAGIEELLKALGVVALALAARVYVRSLMDGFVFGAVVGLGFQVVENVIVAVNAVAVQAGADRVGPVVSTFLLRGFLAGLWSHALFTALAGAGVAYLLVRTEHGWARRAFGGAALIGAAWGFHLLWNSPLLADGFGFGVVGALTVLLIKGVPVLLVGLTLFLTAEQRQADYYAGLLARLGDRQVATAAEIDALVSPRRRLAARRQARLRLGRSGARAMRQLQRAQAQVAVALARDPGAAVTRGRRRVLASRHQLMALSLANQVRPVDEHALRGVVAAIATVGLIIAMLAGAVALGVWAMGGA
ncbi:MAG TPA: PrsW family intramembrane metalloprotease [Micromonosporaceae bacterium]